MIAHRLTALLYGLVLALALPMQPAEARSSVQPPQPVDLVDPFIGTDGTGHTFPGPSRPFGMVQPGPDNADTGWEFGNFWSRADGSGTPHSGTKRSFTRKAPIGMLPQKQTSTRRIWKDFWAACQ